MLFNGEPVELPENWSNMTVFLGCTKSCAGEILNSLEFSNVGFQSITPD